jgi:hypothetical protein
LLPGSEVLLKAKIVALSGSGVLLDLGKLNSDVSKVLGNFSSWALHGNNSLSDSDGDYIARLTNLFR